MTTRRKRPRQWAAEWLLFELTKGPKDSWSLRYRWTGSQSTLYRAADDLGVVMDQRAGTWSLPLPVPADWGQVS